MMMECSKSLAPHTGKVFEIISQLECIKQRIKKLERIQRLLNEETETKIKIYGKSRTESRKLPKNLELSVFLCTFANER